MNKYVNDLHMKVITIFLILASELAFSCSPKEQVSTEEAIAQSDAIVIATVVDYWVKKTPGFEKTILFKVNQVISGKYDLPTIKLSGRIENKTVRNMGEVPYQESRKHNSRGACGARDYEYAGMYLLILSNNTPYWAYNAPTNELVSGMNDPWVLWVKGFVSGRKFK